KTSARNQFLGTVTRTKSGTVNDEVELEIAGGQKLAAIVTQESTESLGLKPGAEAFALVKSSSVILMDEEDGTRVSARTRPTGTTRRNPPGAVNGEVVLDLPGGATLAAIVTRESSDTLDLAVARKVTATFMASGVIVGVPA